MHEIDNDDIDSSLLYLVSISRTEIITVPADPVPPTMNERRAEVFLLEYLSALYSPMGTMNVQQYVNGMERIGGASSSETNTDAVQYADDTVRVQETAQAPIQDTDTTQIQDTDSAQTQDTDSDQTPDTAQDTPDTQDT